MSYFLEEPVLVLETMEDVRVAAENPGLKIQYPGLIQYRIKSLWLIGLIEEILAANPGRDIAYNAEVKRLAEQRLGYPPKTEAEYAREGDNLSLLIYNAQSYRRSDLYRSEGYAPFSEAMLEEAGEGGQIAFRRGRSLVRIVVNGVEDKSDPADEIYNVRRVGGRLYAMKPKKRKWAAQVLGQPARVVPEPAKKSGRQKARCGN